MWQACWRPACSTPGRPVSVAAVGGLVGGGAVGPWHSDHHLQQRPLHADAVQSQWFMRCPSSHAFCSTNREQPGCHGWPSTVSIPGRASHPVPCLLCTAVVRLAVIRLAQCKLHDLQLMPLHNSRPPLAVWHAQPAPDARQLPRRLQPAVLGCHGLQVGAVVGWGICAKNQGVR